MAEREVVHMEQVSSGSTDPNVSESTTSAAERSPDNPAQEHSASESVDGTPAEQHSAGESVVTPEKGKPGARALIITWARRVLLVLVCVFIAQQLYDHWATMWRTVQTIPWEATLGSQLAAIAAVFVAVLAWRTLVNGLGARLGLIRAAQVNLVGLLGKYIPGSVFAYVMQIELGRKAGLSRARVFVATMIGVATGMVAAVIYAVASIGPLSEKLPWIVYLIPLLPVGLIALCPPILTRLVNLALKILRRPALEEPIRWLMVVKSLFFQLLAFGCYGLHLWILAQALGAAPGFAGILLCSAAISVGFNAGILVFVIPSGLGVREGVIAGMLVSTLAYPAGFALAIVSRVMLVIADVVGAGIAAGLAKWKAPITAEATSDGRGIQPETEG